VVVKGLLLVCFAGAGDGRKRRRRRRRRRRKKTEWRRSCVEQP